MSPLYRETPLIDSPVLSRKLSKEVYLKLENLQPSGSFKNRGIGFLCRQFASEGAKLFVASSGGNAGLAVAHAGNCLGVPVKVVVPETTSPYMRDKIEKEGAEVIVHGENWNASDPLARELSAPESAYYIPPFDHPLIWEGLATMIQEVADAGLKPDVVLLSVGGGGLFCGVVEGMRQQGWNDVPVIAVETEGAPTLSRSMEEGKIVTLDAIKTVATSLGATRVTEQALTWTKTHPVISKLVTDDQALRAVEKFADDHRMLVEPACGATLSLLYEQDECLKPFRKILAIVYGGAGIKQQL